VSLDPVFVDTWGWIALGHRRDSRHAEVKKFFEELRQQRVAIFTSDYVFDEVITLLFRREHCLEAIRFMEGLLAAASIGHLIVERITSDRFTATWRLRNQLQDKPRISFTDLTSMVIMRELNITCVLTEDDHFCQVGMGFQKVP
jgi:uncharacterized protein